MIPWIEAVLGGEGCPEHPLTVWDSKPFRDGTAGCCWLSIYKSA